YLRRKLALKNTGTEVKRHLKPISNRFIEIILDLLSKPGSDFDVTVLQIYQQTLNVCQRVKKEADKFRRGASKNGSSWPQKFAELNLDDAPSYCAAHVAVVA